MGPQASCRPAVSSSGEIPREIPQEIPGAEHLGRYRSRRRREGQVDVTDKTRVFARIEQVTELPRPGRRDGTELIVIVPGQSRYQRLSAQLPAQSHLGPDSTRPGSLPGGRLRPPGIADLPVNGIRRREMARPVRFRSVSAVRRAVDIVVRRRH